MLLYSPFTFNLQLKQCPQTQLGTRCALVAVYLCSSSATITWKHTCKCLPHMWRPRPMRFARAHPGMWNGERLARVWRCSAQRQMKDTATLQGVGLQPPQGQRVLGCHNEKERSIQDGAQRPGDGWYLQSSSLDSFNTLHFAPWNRATLEGD